MHNLRAYLRKEFLQELSYKFSFLLNLVAILSNIAIFFFINKLFGGKFSESLLMYGSDYFSYVLVGIAFFSYLGSSLSGIAQRIRGEQLMGTFEFLLSTPLSPVRLLFYISIWNCLFASLNVFVYLLIGSLIFGLDFSRANIISISVVLILTIVSFSSLGIMASAFITYFKRGNPITWVMSTAFGLLGGVYFPIDVLPQSLKKISYLLPITYSIKSLELAIHKGYTLKDLSFEILLLLIFCIVFLPISIFFFRLAIHKVKKDGTLSWY
jgi:ABC-2 type transport system permease protein